MAKEKKTITTKTIRITILGCLFLGLISMLVGLSIYGGNLLREYVKVSFNMARFASYVAQRGMDASELADEIMGVYNSLTEEQRSKVGTPEYREYFADLKSTKNDEYRALVSMLGVLRGMDDVEDVYLALYVDGEDKLVYFADPDSKYVMEPGDWEYVNRGESAKFNSWDGEGMLYDVSSTERYGWLCTSGVPLRDSTGRIYAFALADVTVQSVVDGIISYAVKLGFALLICAFLIGVFIARKMNREVAQPVNKIAAAAEEFSIARRDGKLNPNTFKDLKIETGDELEELSLIMANMETDIYKHEELMTRITAEKERIASELDTARAIQKSMLPSQFFDNLQAFMQPAREVGGDFYDFFKPDADHLCLVMADVSGKGVPAALFMMISKVILQSVAMLGKKPVEILSKTNEALTSNNQVEMFVTVWLGMLNEKTGKLVAVNAGHEFPAIYRAKTKKFELFKDTHCFVVGGMPDIVFKDYTLTLEKGDKLFLYTDGVTEATNSDGQLFGTERLISALNKKPGDSCKNIIETVKKEVDKFVNGAVQFDDITMMCYEYIGPQT